jgi:conjugative transfer region lipoprotein (TIGR03751 family)
MRRNWTEAGLWLLALSLLGGCATDTQELLARDKSSMLDIWRQQTGGAGQGALLDARLTLRRPLDAHERATPNAAYTRSAASEIRSQFPRLPNPDLVMYVFPHLAGSEPVPVPGYSTVFPFYQRVQYALPGERLEDL